MERTVCSAAVSSVSQGGENRSGAKQGSAIDLLQAFRMSTRQVSWQSVRIAGNAGGRIIEVVYG